MNILPNKTKQKKDLLKLLLLQYEKLGHSCPPIVALGPAVDSLPASSLLMLVLDHGT